MGRILVGSSSWADKGLIESGKFYPPQVRAPEDRLRYYASQFPIVQVDSSWYAIPREATARLWAQRTPADFVFDIKAFRLFTRHQTPVMSLPPDVRQALPGTLMAKEMIYFDDVPYELRAELWRLYREAVRPLQATGKLGTVLLQMAPWFLPNPQADSHLLDCKRELDGSHVSVEFRNAAWFSESRRQKTLDFLAANDFTHVIVDEPQGFKNSVPLVPAVTSPRLAYLRLHGRNKATWARKDLRSSADRFNYDYSEAELKEFVPLARQLAERANAVHVLFNNNYQDQSQRNSAALAKLLRDSS